MIDRVLMPTATNGTSSDTFYVPLNAKALTVHVPALVGAAATLKLQALKPKLQENDSDSWGDVTIFDVTDGSYEAVDGLAESTVVTLPTAVIGGGPFKFVASEAQTGAADAIEIMIKWLL